MQVNVKERRKNQGPASCNGTAPLSTNARHSQSQTSQGEKKYVAVINVPAFPALAKGSRTRSAPVVSGSFLAAAPWSNYKRPIAPSSVKWDVPSLA